MALSIQAFHGLHCRSACHVSIHEAFQQGQQIVELEQSQATASPEQLQIANLGRL